MTNGTHFLIYTTEEGGKFKTIGRSTPEEFEQIKKDRKIDLYDFPDDMTEEVEPFFIMLLKCEDNYDWGLGRSRDDQAPA